MIFLYFFVLHSVILFNHGNAYNGAVIMTKVGLIARVHPVHLINIDWAPGGRPSTWTIGHTWAVVGLMLAFRSESWPHTGLSPFSDFALFRPRSKAEYYDGPICKSVCVYPAAYAGPALAFWRPYANRNLAAPDHHKSQSVTIES